MQFLQAIVLGVVQGLTEFIPVSSSGHLLLFEKLMGWNCEEMTFDIAVHWGTLVAVLSFFWHDWTSIATSFARRIFRRIPYEQQPDGSRMGRLALPIIVATVPAAVIGYKFDSQIEGMRDRPWMLAVVATALIVVAVVMLLAERVGQKKRAMGQMTYADYIVIGFAQALALIPGVSRSGATISAGLFRGLDRGSAARFSFLLSTPVIFGAGLVQLKSVLESGLPEGQLSVLIVGFLAAAVSGYLAIKFLMSYLQRAGLKVFAVYRFVLAAGILLSFLR